MRRPHWLAACILLLVSYEDDGPGFQDVGDESSVTTDSEPEEEAPVRPAAKKKKGRKSSWKEEHINDMINVICSSEKYRKEKEIDFHQYQKL